MSWSDKAVSPCLYAPVGGEMTLEKTTIAQHTLDRLAVSGGKLVQTALNNFVPVRLKNVYKHSALAHYGSEHLHIFRTAAGSWLYVFAYGILRSTDNRITWTMVRAGNNRGPFTQLPTGRILAWSSYSDDDGATWVTFSKTQGIYSAGPRRSPVTGTIVGGCSRDTAKFSLIRSTDNGATWAYIYVTDQVTNNYFDPYYVFCASTGTWFCGTQFTGVYRSTDDGATWSFVAAGALSAVYAIQEHPDGRIFAIGQHRLWVSSNDGASFSECKYDTTVFRGGVFVKFFGNFGIFAGNMASNPAVAWVRRIDLTTYALDIPGSLATGGGLMTGNGVNITCYNWPQEYGGIIYCPYITDLYTVGFFEIDPTAAIEAELLVANAFTPTAPARLATLPTAVLTLDGTGAAGTVALYLQHFNDVVGRWESYSGVPDDDTLASWTSAGAPAASTTTYDLPTLPARAGEMVRARLVFQSTDGTLPAPAFVSLSLSWTSDVAAPVAPTIASILGVGGANALCNMGSVPAQARHLIAEVNVDGAGFVPFSKRNKVESGHDYMEFLGPKDIDEQAGGRNSIQVLVENLTLGQTVVVRGKAVDDVGNVSSASDSPEITIGGSLPELYIEDAVVFSGGTANIRVHLVGQTDDEVTVDLATVEGTATDPEHFTGVDTTVTFASGSDELHRWADVEINAVGSDTILGTLNYTVALSNPVGATIERGTGTVTVKGILVQRVPTHRMTFRQRAPMKLVWRQTQ